MQKVHGDIRKMNWALSISTLLLLLRYHVHAQGIEPPSVTINVNWASISVPPSYLGFSHEFKDLSPEILSSPQYRGLLKLLGSFGNNGPIILRWGGNSQDKLNTSLPDSSWQALLDLYQDLGVKHMIGLNLLVRNSSAKTADPHA